MVESIDILTLRQYFRIITSEPFSLAELGKGTDEARQKAWKKIIEQDAESNKLGSHNRITELLEDKNRAYNRYLRISAALLVLSRKNSESSLEVLKSLSIEANEGQNIFDIANDRINGLIAKMNEIDTEIGDRKRPTFDNCMDEMIIVQSYFPAINLMSTLGEYRAAQRQIRKRPTNNGKSDS